MLEYMEGLYDNDWHQNYKKKNAELRTEVLLKKLKSIKKYTPDFGNLRLHKDIIIFVYDDMKMTGVENFILKNSKYLGEAKSTGNNYIMKNNPSMAFFMDENSKKQRGFIRGEAYAVDAMTVANIDYYKGTFEKVKRVKKYFFLLDQEYSTKVGTKRPSVEAFVWVGLPSFWNDKPGMYIAPSTIPSNDKSKRYYEYCIPKQGGIWNPTNHNFMH